MNMSREREPGADYAEVFKALGDPLRVRIFQLLLRVGEPVCVCEIVDALEQPQYQISRHMAVLKRAGLVGYRREGTWVYHYPLRPAGFSDGVWGELQQSFAGDELLGEDLRRLQARMRLREAGRCVVGLQESCDC
ncbi:putative transcriptional regulator [Spirochaeta africana DSM 8902]|uniref:Putative transcriptional regulator n=2 Tax=Spirochaeta TaxID=146 RepID=H9UFT2_SPIAZ|nr:putative transcriptional regulator [Spirochaeta africana DSM 8902]